MLLFLFFLFFGTIIYLVKEMSPFCFFSEHKLQVLNPASQVFLNTH